MNKKWIPIISFSNYNEATIVHSMLEANNIQAVIEDKATIQNYTEAFMHGSIKIYVEAAQIEEAVKILESNGYEVGKSESKFEKKLTRFLNKLVDKFPFLK